MSPAYRAAIPDRDIPNVVHLVPITLTQPRLDDLKIRAEIRRQARGLAPRFPLRLPSEA